MIRINISLYYNLSFFPISFLLSLSSKFSKLKSHQVQWQKRDLHLLAFSTNIQQLKGTTYSILSLCLVKILHHLLLLLPTPRMHVAVLHFRQLLLLRKSLRRPRLLIRLAALQFRLRNRKDLRVIHQRHLRQSTSSNDGTRSVEFRGYLGRKCLMSRDTCLSAGRIGTRAELQLQFYVDHHHHDHIYGQLGTSGVW